MAPKTKYKYHLTGDIANTDIAFDEYVWAYSSAQAKRFVCHRLQKLHRLVVIFVLWKNVETVS